jgi:hypothetical protein
VLYLLDYYEFWEETPDLSRKLRDIQNRYNVDVVHVEAAASGLPVSQILRTTYGVNAADYHLPSKMNKEDRLNQHIGMIQGKRVVIVLSEDNKKRMEHFVHCLTQFPDKSIHDEAVDTLTMAMRLCTIKKSNRKWR